MLTLCPPKPSTSVMLNWMKLSCQKQELRNFNSVEQAEKSSRKILACSFFTDTQEKNLETIVETKKKLQNVLAGINSFFQVYETNPIHILVSYNIN